MCGHWTAEQRGLSSLTVVPLNFVPVPVRAGAVRLQVLTGELEDPGTVSAQPSAAAWAGARLREGGAIRLPDRRVEPGVKAAVVLGVHASPQLSGTSRYSHQPTKLGGRMVTWWAQGAQIMCSLREAERLPCGLTSLTDR